MKTIGIIIAILILIGLVIALYFILKPYIIKHDTTILFTGGLGSGKTLESVKRAIVLIRKNRSIKWKWPNFKIECSNRFNKWRNYLRNKKFNKLLDRGEFEKAEEYQKKKPLLPYKEKLKKPLIYSNIPIHFKKRLFGFKREWSTQLDIQHILCLKEIREFSVVVIDEFPAFINQFDWDVDLVQKNCNEFITFFRHYIGGHLIINAQSEDEIECHFRRKLNIGVWCFDFHVWPLPILPLFYTNRMCDFMLSENIQTMSTTYIEENTRLHFGLFPRRAYNSRCYKPRYEEIYIKTPKTKKWKQLTTKKVLRLRHYVSPLDTETKVQQKEAMVNKAERLERNEDE